MPYSTASDAGTIIETALSDDQITNIIETSNADIDRRIGSQDASDRLIKKLSMLLTAYTIKNKQPRSQVIDEYSKDTGDILDVWGRESASTGFTRSITLRRQSTTTSTSQRGTSGVNTVMKQ